MRSNNNCRDLNRTCSCRILFRWRHRRRSSMCLWGMAMAILGITITITIINGDHWYRTSNHQIIIHTIHKTTNRGAHLSPSGTTTHIITTPPMATVHNITVNSNKAVSCDPNKPTAIHHNNNLADQWQQARRRNSGRIITSHTVSIRILIISWRINYRLRMDRLLV